MPSNGTAKIKLALRKRELVFLLLTAVAVVAVAIASRAPSGRALDVGSRHFKLESAVSDQEHQKGLSGRESLASDKGMLFTFREEARQCFWMQDMHFSLDIIWADAKHKVVHTEQRVSPDTYPSTFCPQKPASYVIELPAGSIHDTGIRMGQVLNF